MIFDTSGKGDMYTIDDIASPLILYSEDLTTLTSTSALSNILGDRDPATIITVFFPNLTSIKTSVALFSGYSSLKNIILPKAVIIGANTFNGCTSLTSISLPCCGSIGASAFSGCTALANIYIPAVTSFGDGAFQGCSSLTSIRLANSLANIGNSTFYGCTSLVSVQMPALYTVGNYTFYNCTSLTSIDLVGAQSIGNYAFYNCTSLTSINFATVQSVGNYAFYNCTSLNSLNTLGAVGDYAFYGCSSLACATVSLVTSVGSGSFKGCTSLVFLTFYKCTSIGSNSFNGCTSLKLINLADSSTVSSLSNADAIPSNCYIQVPSSLLSSYKSATNWSSIASRIVAIGTYSFTEPNSPSKVEMLNAIYPVGSIYMSVNNVSPASFLGGAWTQLTNRFLVGAGSAYSVNSTGGSSTHTHKYGIQLSEYYGDISLATTSTGLLSYNSSGAISGVVTSRTSKGNLNAVVNNNATTASKTVSAVHYTTESNTAPTSTLPPYLAVYMWKRVL